MKDIIICSPMDGQLIPLTEVNDSVFSSGMLGRGALLSKILKVKFTLHLTVKSLCSMILFMLSV